MAELGVTLLNTVSFETDLPRSIEQLGALADMAAEARIVVGIEFTPSKKIRDFMTGVETVRQVGRPNVGLILDTMHFFRSGSTIAELSSVDPNIVKYVQLCDTLQTPWTDTPSYIEEARFERLTPGTGDAPLADILARVPRDLIVTVEVPRRSNVQTGASVHDIVKPIVDAARALVTEVDAAG